MHLAKVGNQKHQELKFTSDAPSQPGAVQSGGLCFVDPWVDDNAGLVSFQLALLQWNEEKSIPSK